MRVLFLLYLKYPKYFTLNYYENWKHLLEAWGKHELDCQLYKEVVTLDYLECVYDDCFSTHIFKTRQFEELVHQTYRYLSYGEIYLDMCHTQHERVEVREEWLVSEYIEAWKISNKGVK